MKLTFSKINKRVNNKNSRRKTNFAFKKFNHHNLVIVTILLIALPLLLVIVEQQTHIFSHADASTEPKEMLISNISDSSFTVSWVTEKATTGFIQYGTSAEFGNSLQDDREDGLRDRHTHYVTIKKLKPDTLYYYQIVSGVDTYPSKGKPYQQKTAPTLVTTPNITTPIYGKVSLPGNQTPKEGIIYLLPKNGTTIASPVVNGNWILTVDNSRTLDLKDNLKFNQGDMMDAYVEGGSEGTAEVKFSLKSDDTQPAIFLDPKKTIISAEAPKTNRSTVGDLNHDGKINAIDYALSALKIIKK